MNGEEIPPIRVPSVPIHGLNPAEGFLAKRARFRRIAARFGVALPTRGYIAGKLASDPAYAAVLAAVRDTTAPIHDVGCGLGLLAHFLRDAGCDLPIHGTDFDAAKITRARAAATRGGLRDVTFAVGDLAHETPAADTIVLLDVLHYLEFPDQHRLLTTLAARARAGGRVLIRVTLRDASWRFRLTVAQESWTRLSGWIPSRSHFNFPTREQLLAPFAAAGCPCDLSPLWGRTPFNSYWLAARQAE